MRKRKIGVVVISVVAIIGVIVWVRSKYFFDMNDGEISKHDLEVVEEYLKDKYDMNLNIIDCDCSNYDINSNDTIRYTFNFEDIDGFKIYAKLNDSPIKAHKLNKMTLNITNIDFAKQLRKYIEESTGLDCIVNMFSGIENSGQKNYYIFRVTFNNNDNYWIEGYIYEDENIEQATSVNVSNSIVDITGVDDRNNEKDLKDVLEGMKKYWDRFERVE